MSQYRRLSKLDFWGPEIMKTGGVMLQTEKTRQKASFRSGIVALAGGESGEGAGYEVPRTSRKRS
ncbi:hypothetical protein [Photobacterium ganghwense]|uniref:hypothetical protein n=1 Tax=Photobacterium ganghwense TaxID=320778 RepID=UPI0012EE3AD5|nr:hypothetical protein [Photobacterium ganghwense]